MDTLQPNEPVLLDPHAQLEMSFIAEYLRDQGHSLESLRGLVEEEAKRLMAEASRYASAKLTAVETRARFVHDVHGTAPPLS
jgi:cytosine/adenosine deaminase-related metal-dependent hydrolase